MNLRISEVCYRGFRSLQNVQASLDNYTCLIGKNDCGKSTFLRGLQFVFDPSTSLHLDDMCKYPDHEGGCSIEVKIEGVEGHEWACDGVVRIRRRMNQGNSIWEHFGKVPSSQVLKMMSEGGLTRSVLNQSSELPALATINAKLRELSPAGRVSSDTWKQIFSSLSESNQVEFTEDWRIFESEKLPDLVQVVMLEADVRGEDELSGDRSVFSRVAGLILRDSLRTNERMKRAVTDLRNEILQISTKNEDGKWPVSQLNEFETVLNEEISAFDAHISTESELIPPKVPPFEFNVQVKISDQWVTGLEKMGHGLRRSVVFAMLRAHRRLKSADLTNKSNQGPLYLFLVEEPELYLHPQAERRRKKELVELSTLEDAQVVLCTHSAIFADLNEYKGILRFSRPKRMATAVRGWSGGDLDPTERQNLTAIYQLDPNKSSMLFADHVILVEGRSEKISIPAIAENLGLDTQDKEVVDCNGNNQIHTYQEILEGFGIKYVAWLDDDQEEPVKRVREKRTAELGKIVITPTNWENLTGLQPPSARNKMFTSWKHFVHEQNVANEATKARVRAAYNWEDYEADPQVQKSFP